MPRSARCFQKTVCYHVMNRGVNKQMIFADSEDFHEFRRRVAEYKAISGARLYPWTWMNNHYHMLIEVVFDHLRGFVGGVQQSYAPYHHRRHGGTGVFWQGRFESKPVEIGEHLDRKRSLRRRAADGPWPPPEKTRAPRKSASITTQSYALECII